MSIESIKILNHSKLIFSIPIYFRTFKKSSEAYKKAETEYLELRKLEWEKSGTPFPEDVKIRNTVSFNKSWPNWRYNEIISFIEIRFFENKLFAFLFLADAERYNAKMPNKKFVWKDNSYFDSIQLENKNNEEIINWILSLKPTIVVNKSKYRNYYFDFSTIENIDSIIDLSGLAT